jgi:hypothetical protein
LKGKLISVQKFVNLIFASFYQFPHVYNDRNTVKMTSWETCSEAYKISKIQGLLGAWAPTRLRPGPTGGIRTAPRIPASNSVAPPPTSIPGSAPVKDHQIKTDEKILQIDV